MASAELTVKLSGVLVPGVFYIPTCRVPEVWTCRGYGPYPPRTHVVRLLGPTTQLYKAFGLF